MPGFVFQKKSDDANVKAEDTPNSLPAETPVSIKEYGDSMVENGSLIGTVSLSKDHQPIQERALLAFKAFQEAVTNLETVTRRIEELTKATGERLNNSGN